MSTVLFRSIDFETSKKDGGEVVEAGWTDLWFNSDTRKCVIVPPGSMLFGIRGAMDPGAQGTHHITMAEIAGLPPIDLADLQTLVEPADFLSAHHKDYEAVFLTPEITGDRRWVCTLKGAYRAWEEAPEHNLQALRYWRGLELDPALALPAHRAGPDSYVGACILEQLLITETVNDLVKWTKEPRYYPTCPLHKHKGWKWADVPHSYLKWMLSATEMEFDLKFAAQTELNRRAEEGAR